MPTELVYPIAFLPTLQDRTFIRTAEALSKSVVACLHLLLALTQC